MDDVGKLSESLCEMVEGVPWRKVLKRKGGFTQLSQHFGGTGEGGALSLTDATSTSEARMEGFNETDAANLQRVKDAMAEKAIGGGLVSGPDTAAAAAFAALLDAETRRAELTLKAPAQDKSAAAAPGGSWTESVTGRAGNGEALAPAA